MSCKILPLIALLFFSIAVNAQRNFFSDVPEAGARNAGQPRAIVPDKYRTLQLDTNALLNFLKQVPTEASVMANRNAAPLLILPMPDGSQAKFRIWESSTMAPELAAAFPQIRTFTGQGVDDPTATIKLDWTDFGFHAMIATSAGTIFIDPYDRVTKLHYISYNKADLKKKQSFTEDELPQPIRDDLKGISPAGVQAGTCIGTQLRTYRLAVACTGEYALKVASPSAPTVSNVLAKIVTSINRVNGVYERELSIRLVLVANENKVVFTNAATDPFTANNNGANLLGESKRVIDSAIGIANFDIGHTFSTGGGGVAYRGVCNSTYKAQGVTGSLNPTGDAYDIDYVAHEMGHQFSGNHSYNSLLGFCGGNISTTTNAEPGSGVTIMAYAGICDNDNLANNSIDLFHAVSYREIIQYVTTGAGAGCATITNTGNLIPAVNAGVDYTIPDSTSFMLSGSATDGNADPLTYSWEQMDIGGPAGSWNNPVDNAPLFRSFPAVNNGVRHFPKLSDQVRGVRTIGEILPNYARIINFRLTVRDNKAGGGGVCNDEMRVIVDSKGPFRVTYPSAPGVVWTAGEFRTVTWNPAGADLAPVNCANVSIQLSTDSGYTFPVTLVASTPNDGTHEIQVPNNVSANVRIRVMAVGNIFYDISNSNLRIQAAGTPGFAFSNPPTVNMCSALNGVATLNTGSIGGFSTTIQLTASQVPTGGSISFGTASIAPGVSTTVTLNNTGGLAPGSYVIRITGTAGSVIKTRDIVFIVGTGGATPVLSTPGDNDYAIATNTGFNWLPIAAVTYTFEISQLEDFSVITQTVSNFSTLPLLLPEQLEQNTIYYWRVKSTSSCGEGSFSTVFKFKTGLSSCKISADVPKDLAPGSEGETSTLTIAPEQGVTITDINVIGITGNFYAYNDTKLVLVSPANTVVILADALCLNTTGEMNFNLDDQAASGTIPCPPTGNVLARPLNPLSILNGENSAGTWKLITVDNYLNGGLSLTGWGLNINASGTTCMDMSTPLSVSYTFTGNGNWTNAANWSGNLVPPSPLPSGASIIINHIVAGSCILNTNQQISSGASLTVLTGKNLIVPGSLTVQ